MSEIRTIIYAWWRKDDTSLIKFGDHTESFDNTQWQIDTERYIQKTAAPRELKTFKDKIDFIYYDITDYAKKVNRNYKFAKIDNYIARQANVDKYRLGQTDQFKLPKFEIDVEDFINQIKDVIFGGHNLEDRLPVSPDLHISDLRKIEIEKNVTFNFTGDNKILNILNILSFFESKKILIVGSAKEYNSSLFNKYFEFNKFLIRNGTTEDGQFQFADKKIKIVPTMENENITKYDIIIQDLNNISVYLRN